MVLLFYNYLWMFFDFIVILSLGLGERLLPYDTKAINRTEESYEK